jgi:uncharacterized membrane protein YccC
VRRPTEKVKAGWDAVVGSDPGLLRLRIGAIAALSVSLAVLLLAGLAHLQHQPITTQLLGIVMAMSATTLVREADRRSRLVTSALLPVAAAASVTLAVLLSGISALSTGVFVLVMFVAAYIRRYDSRGTTIGMTVFMAYFFALFLRAGPGHLVPLIISAVIGAGCAWVVPEFVLPERHIAVLARLQPALRAQVGTVLDATQAALRDGELTSYADRRLQARLRRLNETALLVEDRVERAGDDRLWPNLSNEGLALRVFDLELATEEVALTTARLLRQPDSAVPAEERRRLARLIGVLRRSLRDDAGISLSALRAADRLADFTQGRPAAPLIKSVQMLIRAISGLRPDGPLKLPELPDRGDRTNHKVNSEEEPGGQTNRTSRLLPSTRQAIQTAVAGALAIAIGTTVAPARWYWAALTAFVVFIGTSSRGETLSRSGQRLFGTLGGVLAGVLVAAIVGGSHPLSLTLIVICMFLAFYLQQVSQALFAFFITVILALLYGLLGQFSIEVLALRLEETAIGVACGALVAHLVLPTRTRHTIQDKLADYANELCTLIDHAIDVLLGMRPGDGLIAEARNLDEATTALRVAARPLSHGVAGLGGRPAIERWLRAALACDQYARELAQVCYPLGWLTPAPTALRDGPSADALREGSNRIRNHLALLRTALTEPRQCTPEPAMPLLDVIRATACPGADAADRTLRDAVHYLIRIDQTVLAALGSTASERLVHTRTATGPER